MKGREKGEQVKPQGGWQGDHKSEKKCAEQKITLRHERTDRAESWFSEKMNKIDKRFSKLIEKNGERTYK